MEDAEEINPERLANPPTVSVEEAESGPASCKELEMVEEAEEITPPT